ncbi:kelch-like protein 40a [Dendronephthya gigantea]|uniref:kelch-like protein 40a n=2 Tax=Dendronephthya gigantea TaxID=151771 RepID=UPI00106A2944|nr:kelch-like protein 40a [Dendronephthya gigantea]XP_028412172.1 kelch-like protein 40a [Dendronephthya gigantea]
MGEGYDPDRFIDRVLHGFKCCICRCVLNEPRLCQAEEHQFCFNCISQHLPNSQTCPECRQHLTLATLKCPGKNLKNLLSELRIKCDHSNRGCPEQVELGNLQNHVSNCEYRPITCGDCYLEVNAKDEDKHKKSFCQLGGANISGLKDIKLRQEEMKDNFTIIKARQKEFTDKQKELEETQNVYGQKIADIHDDLDEMEGNQRRQKRKLKEVVNSCEQIRTLLDEVEDDQNLQRQELNEVTNSSEEIHTFTNSIQDEMRGEVTELKRRHDQIYDKVKKMKASVHQLTPSQDKMKIEMLEMARKQDQMEARQDDVKKDLEEIKQTQEGINENVGEMKASVQQLTPSQDKMKIEMLEMARKQDKMEARQDDLKKSLEEIKQTQEGINEDAGEMKGVFEMMKLQFDRFEGLMGHLFQQDNINRSGAETNTAVIIIGGLMPPVSNIPIFNTVEQYDIVEKRSTMLPPLNHPRVSLASCVYNNDVLVVGGSSGNEDTDEIEVLKVDQHPLRWTIFDAKLPVKTSAHDVIVYQGKLYIIGGYDINKGITSNAIYEIALTPPYAAKLLTRMTEARQSHQAELINEKIFILGGSSGGHHNNALDSVVAYDLIRNKFERCPSLPRHVYNMSTVTWGDKIIIVGGKQKNDETLNDVIMYHTETGQSEILPSMIYKRNAPSAVIVNDVIFVFGGYNNQQNHLNSVETFTIGGNGWEELPAMMEKRCWMTAVVKPHI